MAEKSSFDLDKNEKILRGTNYISWKFYYSLDLL